MGRALTPATPSWYGMTHDWWQKILFSIILTTLTTGVVYILYCAVLWAICYYKSRSKRDLLSLRSSAFLENLQSQIVKRSKHSPRKALSFDVYLGPMESSLTPSQLNLLTRSDLTILDLLRIDAASAIKDIQGQCFLGRVDLRNEASANASPDDVFEELANLMLTTSHKPQWTGIVLAGWEAFFSTAYLDAVLRVIDDLGLLLYLEVGPPDFIQNDSIFSSNTISGLVIRNAAILSNGQHRDYFDMKSLQPTIRAVVRECCYRTFNILAWEEIEHGAFVTQAVLKRTKKWCDFYNIVPWVGSSTATAGATINEPYLEPLSAFDWLKEDEVMRVHASWRGNSSIMHERNKSAAAAWTEISRLLPSTSNFLESNQRFSCTSSRASLASTNTLAVTRSRSPLSHTQPAVDQDHYIKHMGCFPLGVEVTPLALAEVWQAQLRLKNLGLVEVLDSQSIADMGMLLLKFHHRHLILAYEHDQDILAAVKELFNLARSDILKVNMLLNPSFKHCSGARFWAICAEDEQSTEIYISKDAQDLVGTVLHAFLSSRGFGRDTCMEMEAALARWSGTLDKTSGLPQRLCQDVESLTPKEKIILLQQIASAEHSNDVSATVGTYIRKSLIDKPSLTQLSELSSIRYLGRKITAAELLCARFEWYDEQEASHPSFDVAMTFFRELQDKLTHILQIRQLSGLNTLLIALKSTLSTGQIDAWADVMALATFCFVRSAAFDEVYVEVLDRNPLLNDQPDQAAIFAECFALGSHCDAYFDITPNAFGKLLSDRFRSEYQHKQPPIWINGAPEFATVYSGAQIDADRNRTTKQVPKFQRFTALSVFAVPALLDIMLLTITGRGLYLTAFMTVDEQRNATIALLSALLVSGAAGTSICCGGSYYLTSMAFSAMNVFVLSRLAAGIAFAIFGAAIAFIVIAGVKGAYLGVVFALYFVGFMAYLTLFAAIASFQFPGSSFLSGRKYIFFCLPWLLMSPIISMWAGHDVAIYLTTIYVVISMLIVVLRNIGAQWNTWYKDLKITDDSEVRNWYTVTRNAGDASILSSMTDPAALKVSREALYQDVCTEMKRGFFSTPTDNDLVRRLAADFEATSFLLDWYCRYSDVPRPIPYSSSWNIQTKVALNTLRDAQKGQRVHSAFIHWRQTADEIGCGFVYFLVALLDKWVQILSGAQLTGLSASFNDQNRVAVGFGLAYYLIGAVLIDMKAQALHDFVNESQSEGIRTGADFRESQKRSIHSRRIMYYRTLLRFLSWHCWSLTLTGTLVWLFQDSAQTVFMFIAYVFAYTGLLWYQYTKIFSGPHALKPLLAAVCLGLPIGLVLKKTIPNFLYTGVITLTIATWTAAFLCLWTADIDVPRADNAITRRDETFHAYQKPWADPEWSQTELKTIYTNLKSLPADYRHFVTPLQNPGLEVRQLLLNSYADHSLEAVLPNWEEMVSQTVDAWEKGEIEIQLVPRSALGSEMRAISYRANNRVVLLIGVANNTPLSSSIQEDPKSIAEFLLHEIAEIYFDLQHHHAYLAEHLVGGSVPENIKLLLDEETDLLRVNDWANKELLKQQCCGVDCDLEWDQLPRAARRFFLRRCVEDSVTLSKAEREVLLTIPCLSNIKDLDLHIARCDLARTLIAKIIEHGIRASDERPRTPSFETEEPPKTSTSIRSSVKLPFGFIYHAVGLTFKLIVVAMLADAEAQRELDYSIHDKFALVRVPLTFALNCLWMYGKLVQDNVLPFFLFYHRPDIKKLWEESQGVTILHKRNRMIIQGQKTTQTAFKQKGPMGGFKLFQYDGIHAEEPTGQPYLLRTVANYSNDKELLGKETYANGEITDKYEYIYNSPRPKQVFLGRRKPRIPVRRRCVQGKIQRETLSYNEKGIVISGAYIKDGELTHFTLHYRKNGYYLDELLRAEYTMAYMSCVVSWCAPPRRHPERLEKWIPHSKVMEATFIQGVDEYKSKWTYDHRFHPTISTTMNGKPVPTPPMIEHDWFAILSKPNIDGFAEENPYLNSGGSTIDKFWGLLGLSKRLFPISISQGRSRIWKTWKQGNDLDGVTMEWLDEKLLRKDRLLAPYWRYRNLGNLREAKRYLNKHADAVVASADLDDEISGWAPLAIKLDDLYNFGAAGDAILHTKSEDVGYDTRSTLHVLAADNGTWPIEGGGVSACRRDVVNTLKTIKWHMLCESATDFGVPKFQTERNVHSLKIVPLWGLDFLSPNHGLFKNRLHAEVNAVSSDATDMEIQKHFIPCLTALVKGARAIDLSSADLQQATRALVSLNEFFQNCRNWNQVWTSAPAKYTWRSLWLDEHMPNTRPPSEWLDTELPTLGHLDTALELWFRYLFVFSIRVPDRIPGVYQVSHHSVSAAYGIVCKVKRHCQLQVWDHGISWRETNMCLSATLCKLPPFVRNSLLGLMRLTSVLVLHHADVILPCADFFNPGWETEIGTCQGMIEHRNKFQRKIAPVVNGITDAGKFKPIEEIITKSPTVTMLSHLWFAKDLKTAILAADIIINEWGFTDYQLDIYGSIEKAPTYSNECQELIASKSLRNQVHLRGTADPLTVLSQTWLFMNSSLSEGLPLALGEAALTGVPIVATDVGASLRVLSDPVNPSARFSAVVPPNDPRALARAQIKLLALLDEYAIYASDSDSDPSISSLPTTPTPTDIANITARMYAQSPQRRALGLRNRAIVQRSFSGARYLREHEQMLWIGKSAHFSAERLRAARDRTGFIRTPIIAAPDMNVCVIPRSVAPSYWRGGPSPAPGSVGYRGSGEGSFMQSTGSGAGVSLSVRASSWLSVAESGGGASGRSMLRQTPSPGTASLNIPKRTSSAMNAGLGGRGFLARLQSGLSVGSGGRESRTSSGMGMERDSPARGAMEMEQRNTGLKRSKLGTTVMCEEDVVDDDDDVGGGSKEMRNSMCDFQTV